MPLNEEITEKRSTIHSDGYPMSIGELATMYKDGELDIHPEFQRFFRWSESQKTRLIESILLGIPIPSIFVSQRADGVWDVIDGLQRLSTIFQFMGILRQYVDPDNEDLVVPDGESFLADDDYIDIELPPPSNGLISNGLMKPLVLESTYYLPSLAGRVWDDLSEDTIGKGNQLIIKRAKIDIKIILRESDENSKFELFQRLNSGGSELSDQELRNCVLIMVNRGFYKWVAQLSRNSDFNKCAALTDRSRTEKYDMELVSRFITFRTIDVDKISNIGDIGEFLTTSLIEKAKDPNFDRETHEEAFRVTFSILATVLEQDSFRRYIPNSERFSGGFLISAFESVAIGLGNNYKSYADGYDRGDVIDRVKRLWADPIFLKGIGSGKRGSQRVPVTIPVGRNAFKKRNPVKK